MSTAERDCSFSLLVSNDLAMETAAFSHQHVQQLQPRKRLAMLNHRPELNDTSALLILEAARTHATTIGVPQNIVIVDASGRMLAMCRMQGAKFLSMETATAKAVTAASISAPTGNIPAEFGALLGITTQGKITNLKGGLPVIIDGQLAGAVGVGSGAPDEDIAVAQAGIDALMQALA